MGTGFLALEGACSLGQEGGDPCKGSMTKMCVCLNICLLESPIVMQAEAIRIIKISLYLGFFFPSERIGNRHQ